MGKEAGEHVRESFRVVHEAQERLKALRIEYEVTHAATFSGSQAPSAVSLLSRERYARAIGDYFVSPTA